MHIRKVPTRLGEAKDGALLLRPPNFEGIDVFRRDTAGALGLVPLSVDLVATMSKAGECLSAQVGQLCRVVGVMPLKRCRERAVTGAASLVERVFSGRSQRDGRERRQ